MSGTDVLFDTHLLLYLLSGNAAQADRAESLLAEGDVSPRANSWHGP